MRTSKCRLLAYFASLIPFFVATVHASQFTPPSVIYHFGRAEVLIKNARLDNVPQDDWDKYIMGNDTSFTLPPFRKGFYGTVHPMYAESYGTAPEGLFIGIGIKDECRQDSAVAIPSYLPQDQKFLAWFESNKASLKFASLEGFTTACFRRPTVPVLDFQFIMDEPNVDSSGGNDCSSTLQRFYTEARIKVILDEQVIEQEDIEYNILNPVSWYIRDRACISFIDGAPEDFVELLTKVKDPWTPQAFFDAQGKLSASIGEGFMMYISLIESLVAAPEAPSDVQLQKLLIVSSNAKHVWSAFAEDNRTVIKLPVKEATTRLLKSFIKARKSGKLDMIKLEVKNLFDRAKKGNYHLLGPHDLNLKSLKLMLNKMNSL